MIRRLRLILPYPGIVIMLAPFVVAQAFLLISEWKLGQAIPIENRAGLEHAVLFGPLIMYAGWRVLLFHPVFLPSYRAWLELTPWTSRKPLPVGPVSLVPEDGVVLAMLCLLATLCPSVDPLRVVLVFLITHITLLGVSLAPTGCLAWGYAVAFGLGLVVRLWLDPLAALAAAALVSLLAHVGLWRSLARFPWSFEATKAVFHTGGTIALADAKPGPPCGWPFDRLRPQCAGPLTFRTRDAAILGSLAGWWAFAILGFFSQQMDREVMAILMLIMVLSFVSMARLIVYVSGYASPISFWGRLVTGRWIIPGYDKVLVAPMFAVVVPLWLLYELWVAGLPLEVRGPIALAVSVTLGLAMGPSLERWRLTGHHRIYPNPQQRDLVKLG